MATGDGRTRAAAVRHGTAAEGVASVYLAARDTRVRTSLRMRPRRGERNPGVAAADEIMADHGTVAENDVSTDVAARTAVGDVAADKSEGAEGERGHHCRARRPSGMPIRTDEAAGGEGEREAVALDEAGDGRVESRPCLTTTAMRRVVANKDTDGRGSGGHCLRGRVRADGRGRRRHGRGHRGGVGAGAEDAGTDKVSGTRRREPRVGCWLCCYR